MTRGSPTLAPAWDGYDFSFSSYPEERRSHGFPWRSECSTTHTQTDIPSFADAIARLLP